MIAALALCQILSSGQDRPLSSQGLQDLLKGQCQASGLPALAAAYVYESKKPVIGIYGRRVIDGDEPIQLTDKFHIGSCTKSMTAVLAAMSVESGKLRWESTLAEVFKDVKVNRRLKDVTLAQLLRHRSGLRSDLTPSEAIAAIESRKTPQDQRRERSRKLLQEEPAFTPGSGFHYANLGYMVVGAMLERVEKKPWETLMRDRLFKPLSMSSAGFGAPATAGKRDQPWGHLSQPDGSFTSFAPGPGADNPAVIGPGATVHCSIADQLKYCQFQLTQSKLIKKTSFAKFRQDPDGQHYGMGWVLAEQAWTNGVALTHVGSNTMFTTMMWVVPGRDLAIVVSANAGGDRALEACNNIVIGIINSLTANQTR